MSIEVCSWSKREELRVGDGGMEEAGPFVKGLPFSTVPHSPPSLSNQLGGGGKLWWDMGVEEECGNCQINTPSGEASQGWAQNIWNGTHLPSEAGSGVGS